MLEEREKIRELHQRQQDSLKSLQALENRLCKVALDDEETLQGSSVSSCVPTLELMLGPQSTTLPPLERNQRPSNNATLSGRDASDTSESDATATDDESEHLSLEELAKCAKHVQRLLKRITRLQQSFEGSQQIRPQRRSRVHKMYQRFRHKFESDLQVVSPPLPPPVAVPPPQVAGSLSGFEWLEHPGELNNFDSDSFLANPEVDQDMGEAPLSEFDSHTAPGFSMEEMLNAQDPGPQKYEPPPPPRLQEFHDRAVQNTEAYNQRYWQAPGQDPWESQQEIVREPSQQTALGQDIDLSEFLISPSEPTVPPQDNLYFATAQNLVHRPYSHVPRTQLQNNSLVEMQLTSARASSPPDQHGFVNHDASPSLFVDNYNASSSLFMEEPAQHQAQKQGQARASNQGATEPAVPMLNRSMIPSQRAPHQMMPIQPPPFQVQTQPRNHALEDYHFQLALLEQQKKKRLLMARQEHADTTSSKAGDAPATNEHYFRSASPRRTRTFKNLVGSKRKGSHNPSPAPQGTQTPTGQQRPTSLSPLVHQVQQKDASAASQPSKRYLWYNSQPEKCMNSGESERLPMRPASDAESEVWEPCSRTLTTEQARLSEMPTNIDPLIQQQLLKVPEQEFRTFLQTHLREAQEKFQTGSSFPQPLPKEPSVPTGPWYKGPRSVIKRTRSRSDIGSGPGLAELMTQHTAPDAAEHPSYSSETSQELPSTSSPAPTPRSILPTTLPLPLTQSYYGSISDGKACYRKNTKGLLLGKEERVSGKNERIMDSESSLDLPLNTRSEDSTCIELDPPLLQVSRPMAACSRCQADKVKCDGKLPTCTSCEESNSASERSTTGRATSDATATKIPPITSWYQPASPIQLASSQSMPTYDLHPPTSASAGYGPGLSRRVSRGRRRLSSHLTEDQKQDAHEMRQIGACSNCRELREKVCTARMHRTLVTHSIQCDQDIPCSSCVKRYTRNKPLLNEDCRGRNIAEHSRSATAGADNNGPPSNLRDTIPERSTSRGGGFHGQSGYNSRDGYNTALPGALQGRSGYNRETHGTAMAEALQGRGGIVDAVPASKSDNVADPHSRVDVEMDMLGEPAMASQKQGRRRLRSTNKRNAPRTNSIRQSLNVKPARRKEHIFSKAPPKEVTAPVQQAESPSPFMALDMAESHLYLPDISSSSGYASAVEPDHYASIPRTEESLLSMDQPFPDFGQVDAMSVPEVNFDSVSPSPQAVSEEPKPNHRKPSSPFLSMSSEPQRMDEGYHHVLDRQPAAEPFRARPQEPSNQYYQPERAEVRMPDPRASRKYEGEEENEQSEEETPKRRAERARFVPEELDRYPGYDLDAEPAASSPPVPSPPQQNDYQSLPLSQPKPLHAPGGIHPPDTGSRVQIDDLHKPSKGASRRNHTNTGALSPSMLDSRQGSGRSGLGPSLMGNRDDSNNSLRAARHSKSTPIDNSQSMYDSRQINEWFVPSGDKDEQEEEGVQSKKRGRSSSSSLVPMVESRLIDENSDDDLTVSPMDTDIAVTGMNKSFSANPAMGTIPMLDFPTGDGEDKREDVDKKRKRRKLVRGKEDSVESEDLLLLGDRDIVDVLLEQWTVPVY
jgi:hypothetical protein